MLNDKPEYSLFTPLVIILFYSALAKSKIKTSYRLINVAIPVIEERSDIEDLNNAKKLTTGKENAIRSVLTMKLKDKINSLFSFSWTSCLQRKQKVIFIENSVTGIIYAILQIYSKSEQTCIYIDEKDKTYKDNQYKSRKFSPLLRKDSLSTFYMDKGKGNAIL